MFSNDDVQTRLTQFYQTALADNFIRVSDVESVSGGWEAWLYKFSLHTQVASPQSLIIRLFPGNSDGKAQHEFAAMQGLKKLNFPVPNVYHLTTYQDSPFDASFFIMDFVEGQSLWGIIVEDGQVNAELLTKYCQLMADLHTLEWEGVFDSPLQADNPFAAIDHFLGEAHAAIQNESLADFAPIVEWIAARRDEVPCSRLSLTHNDFHPFNVLVQDDGAMMVIDWSNFRIYDYRYDLAWALLLSGTFESRSASDAILNIYQTMRGEPVEQMDIYTVIAIVRRLSDMAISIRGSAAERGMRTDAVDAMRQYAYHFRACYAWLEAITGIRIASLESLLASLDQ